jgi:hypothetical protein
MYKHGFECAACSKEVGRGGERSQERKQNKER